MTTGEKTVFYTCSTWYAGRARMSTIAKQDFGECASKSLTCNRTDTLQILVARHTSRRTRANTPANFPIYRWPLRLSHDVNHNSSFQQPNSEPLLLPLPDNIYTSPILLQHLTSRTRHANHPSRTKCSPRVYHPACIDPFVRT